MKKRFISILLSVCMITSLLPVFGTTAFAADTVTRAEWISQLVETFAMTVENDDNMPDNYFSDITEDDSCYRDILLAVEFGVIDIEAGDAFEPDKPTTREFAAQTLNHALQFQLAEDAEYTYSESGDVTYPDDIQVAVNRGWFALSGDNFLPEKAVTSAEADAMLADAANVLDADVIDENYDSTYEFAAGVIEIPQTADVSISADTVTITDCSESISAGDIFVVYTSGYPIAFKALSVETVDNTIVINVTTDGTEDAIVSVDAEGIIDIDLENFEANELTTYSITNMETGKQEELTVELMGISYDKKSKTLTASQQIKIGKSAAGSVSIKMSNLKLNHKENILTNNYMAYITADTTVTTAISFDFGNYAGLPSSMTLGYINIYGIGSISLTFECAIEGGVSMAWDGKLKTGFTYTEHDGFRFEKEYTQKDFTFTAETKINACVRLTAAIDLVLIKGSVWGTIGVRVNFIYKDHGSGKPKMCETLNGYLYARVGVDVEIIGIDVFNRSVDIFTENNSPVRVYSHYEDSLRVEACTRGQDVKYVTKTSSKYFNPAPSYGQSSYESSGSSSGNGSSGGSSGGSGSGTSETVVIWEYKVDSDNNATITGYKGTSTAVAIPSKIDGYTVTAIGSSAFKNNKSIKSVTMPNTIIAIGSSAFYNCTNLSNVQLPAYIEKLEYYAFSGCDSLTEIVIPKTLTSCPGSLGYGYGPFNGSGIVTAEFEDGMTEIPSDVFLGSNKLKNVKIPDTVIKIKNEAFRGCSSLETIKIPNTVIEIENEAFYGCTNLSNCALPPYIERLGYYAFRGCDSLTEIVIPKTLTSCPGSLGYGYGPFNGSGIVTAEFEDGMTEIPSDVFLGSNKLKNVKIPDTVIKIKNEAFRGCSSLETIKIPNNVTHIEESIFSGCSSLKEISIPDSVTSMGTQIFKNCTSLEKVKLPIKYNNIPESTFYNCQNLVEINLSETITSINSSAFYGCSKFENVILPKYLEKIGGSAFYECAALKEITIPDSVTSIGNSAFYNCDSLVIAAVKGSGSIGSNAFYDCDALTTLTIGNGITSIGSNMCYGCDSLTDVTFGIGLTTIPDSAFRLCSSLQEVILPRYCTKISANAFAEDTKLTTVTVLPNMTAIENNSFSYPAKTTIRGVSGSYAQEYANSRNMTFEAINIPATGLEFYKDEIEFSGTNKTAVLPLSISPLDSTDTITYTSADESIATVANGIVTSKGYGTTTITAVSDSGKRDTITVNILRSATSVSLNKTSLNLKIGATETLTAKMQPSDATDKITWTTSNNKVATVNNGIVTAVGVGTAVITVTTTSGKTATCTVEVTDTSATTPSPTPTASPSSTPTASPSSTPTASPSSTPTPIPDDSYSGTCGDNLTWTLSGGTLTISGTGNMDNWFYSLEPVPWKEYKDDIKSVVIEKGVTSIGGSAFDSCGNLKNVKIPESVKIIEEWAFSSCDGLESITIPEGVTSIGFGAFSVCFYMESIYIPKSVTSIDEWAFYGCLDLTDVYYGGSEAEWGKIAIGSDNEQLTEATIHYNSSIPESKPVYTVGDIQISGGTVSVNVTKLTGGGARLIVVSYTEGGEFIGVNFKDINEGGTVNVSLNTAGAARVSAFVWDNFTDMTPVSNKANKDL